MRKLMAIVPALVLVAFCAPALAVDVWEGPPDGTWDRYDPNSTYVHWTFHQFNPWPYEFYNPYGPPIIELEPIDGWEYGMWEAPPELGPAGTINGWHCTSPGGGHIMITIPNTPLVDGTKWIFMQVTSSKTVHVIGAASPDMINSGTWNTGRPQIQWPGPAPFGGAWYTYNYGLFIQPNPTYEHIIINVQDCTVIDQIVIDTLCSPGVIGMERNTWSGVKALYR